MWWLGQHRPTCQISGPCLGPSGSGQGSLACGRERKPNKSSQEKRPGTKGWGKKKKKTLSGQDWLRHLSRLGRSRTRWNVQKDPETMKSSNLSPMWPHPLWIARRTPEGSLGFGVHPPAVQVSSPSELLVNVVHDRLRSPFLPATLQDPPVGSRQRET